jgi:DNA-directed RNA polymerase specialized sigma24 family protein
VVNDDKRAAILSRRAKGQSIRKIAAGVGVSVGVVHKTLTPRRETAHECQAKGRCPVISSEPQD